MHTAHACGCVHVHLCLFVLCRHVHSYMYVRTYLCMCLYTCACTVHVYMHTRTCLCVCPSMRTQMGVQHMYICTSVPDCVACISVYYVHSITLRMSTAILCTHTFSACSNSATLAVECTRTFEPNTLILSVSIAVLAMRIRAFSMRFGWFTPTFFSRR